MKHSCPYYRDIYNFPNQFMVHRCLKQKRSEFYNSCIRMGITIQEHYTTCYHYNEFVSNHCVAPGYYPFFSYDALVNYVGFSSTYYARKAVKELSNNRIIQVVEPGSRSSATTYWCRGLLHPTDFDGLEEFDDLNYITYDMESGVFENNSLI